MVKGVPFEASLIKMEETVLQALPDLPERLEQAAVSPTASQQPERPSPKKDERRALFSTSSYRHYEDGNEFIVVHVKEGSEHQVGNNSGCCKQEEQSLEIA